MRVWITKYALTKGIFSIEARVCASTDEKMIADVNEKGSFYHKPDWHEDLYEAIGRGEDMRKKKIVSLRRKIEKLERMDITPSE